MKWYCIPERYDCIDAHNHVWGGPNNGPLNVEQTKQLLYSADCLGIRKLCVSYPITRPGVTVEAMRYVNDIVIEAMKFSDRLIGFCFVDAALGQPAVDEVKRCIVENGMAGIKMYHQQFLDDDVQAPVMELAAELGVPVLMHAGKCTDPATMAAQPYLSNASQFLSAVKKFPNTTFIQGHIGGGGDWEWNLRTLEEMDSDNYFIDISGSVIDAGIVRRTVNAVGIDHVLFATDCSMEEGVGKVQAADLTDDEYMKLFSGNMKRIFARRRA
ncbi:MAG: amidohydrolase family protein [Victivallales bacterium]|nr:amidohydrolase family protein [Victivallales bacterium]